MNIIKLCQKLNKINIIILFIATLMLSGYYGVDYLNRRFDFENLNYNLDSMLGKFLYDLKTFCEASSNQTQEDFIREVGTYHSKYNALSKGKDVMYALSIMVFIIFYDISRKGGPND